MQPATKVGMWIILRKIKKTKIKIKNLAWRAHFEEKRNLDSISSWPGGPERFKTVGFPGAPAKCLQTSVPPNAVGTQVVLND